MHSLGFESELKLTGRFLASLGFHLSATVIPPQSVAQAKGTFSVAVVFDRRRITSCNCTCNCTASWCAHVVALCLFRIHQVNIKMFQNEQNCVRYVCGLWMKNTRIICIFFNRHQMFVYELPCRNLCPDYREINSRSLPSTLSVNYHNRFVLIFLLSSIEIVVS